MKVSKKRIGWQKYEDNIEEQINSPLNKILINSMLPGIEQEDESLQEDEENVGSSTLIMTVSNSIAEQIKLTSNFDCWIGHTNFNLTEDIKNKMNKIDGIEVLRICSRYRFVIGIGKMFNFSEVREEIEQQLTPES